jgi:hypothetical protein
VSEPRSMPMACVSVTWVAVTYVSVTGVARKFAEAAECASDTVAVAMRLAVKRLILLCNVLLSIGTLPGPLG